jgi:hypothetical protein
MISQRTKATLARTKVRIAEQGHYVTRAGRTITRLGGDNIEEARRQSPAVWSAAADQHAAEVLPIIEQIRTSGTTTLLGIATALIQRSIPAARGGAWNATQVRRLLRRV